MWDPAGPGLKPVSPALAGGFLTTVPPGKPQNLDFRRLVGEKEKERKKATLEIKKSMKEGMAWQ